MEHSDHQHQRKPNAKLEAPPRGHGQELDDRNQGGEPDQLRRDHAGVGRDAKRDQRERGDDYQGLERDEQSRLVSAGSLHAVQYCAATSSNESRQLMMDRPTPFAVGT